MIKRENFVKNLDVLTGDTLAAYKKLAAAAPASAPASKADPESEWKVTNPFDSMYRVVYQLTMRTVGADDIAADPALLRHTLALFERFETSGSTAKVVFPWFPTPRHLVRMWTGARLAMVFQRIIDGRKRTGKKGNDPLQFLIDQGASIKHIVAVCFCSLPPPLFLCLSLSRLSQSYYYIVISCEIPGDDEHIYKLDLLENFAY